MNKTVF